MIPIKSTSDENGENSNRDENQSSLDNSLCRCGRLTDNHCPVCGSFNVYAMPSKTLVVSGVEVMFYRCRKCGKLFCESDTQNCRAPFKKSRSDNNKARVQALANRVETELEKSLKGLTKEEKIKALFAKEGRFNK